MSGGNRPQPPGAGARLAEAAADDSGACPDRRGPEFRNGELRLDSLRKAFHRRWFPLRSRLRSRSVRPKPFRPEPQRVGLGHHTRSAHDHENCTVETDQRGHVGDKPVDWSRRRDTVCGGTGPGLCAAGRQCHNESSRNRNRSKCSRCGNQLSFLEAGRRSGQFVIRDTTQGT